ncbi:MAG: Calx-beta domain-containing protein, partial [Cyanobacteriota bacterium]
ATSRTVLFSAGQSTATVTIDPTADTTVENDETVALTLAAGTTYTIGTTAAVIGTISNDDASLSIAATSADKPEGNTGTTTYTFTVTRTGNTSGTSSATWTVTPATGSSITANDFAGNSFPTGTVSFPANSTSQTITINVNGDLQVEPDEAFLITLSNPNGANLDPNASSATGTIRNDDAAALPTITLAASPASVTEDGLDNLTYTFTRTGPTTTPLTVNYTISGDARLDASGPYPADYTILGSTSTATSRTVLFSAGQSTATVTIDPNDDRSQIAEQSFIGDISDKTVVLSLVAGQEYVIDASNNTATGIILNDDVIAEATYSNSDYRLEPWQSTLQLIGTLRINGYGNAMDNVIIGSSGNNTIYGGPGKDILTSSYDFDFDYFTYPSLSDSLLIDPITGALDRFDEITDFDFWDCIAIKAEEGRSDLRLETTAGHLDALSATDCTNLLTSSAFPAYSSAAFAVTGYDGIFLAINDNQAGFQPANDAIIFLRGNSEISYWVDVKCFDWV